VIGIIAMSANQRGDARAKEETWLDEEHFRRLTVELQARTSDLSKVAASGNLARLKVAFEQTRDVCNACHKAFRKK
jgi:cytochrome c556